MYRLERTTRLPVTLQEAWDFFSSPNNLERITPSYMRFKIVSELKKGAMYEGMKIEYTVSPIAGIPLTWVTLISDVKEPYCFKDKQIKGPFKLWEHTHTFVERDGGVEMVDEVLYALPLGIAGRFAHALLVKKQLEGIFNYRRKAIEEIFIKK